MQDERWAEQRQDADVESKCNRECCHRYSCCKCCPWSFGKTCAILPFYPFFSMLAAVAGGLVLIFGMNTVARGSDAARLANGADIITFSSTLYIVAYGGVGTVALIDLILTYSVLTSKLRIHNICGRAECTGFMGTAESPAAKCLACVCKSSIYVVSVLAWLSALLSIAMLMLTTFIAAVALMVVYMCDIEPATINRLLLELLGGSGCWARGERGCLSHGYTRMPDSQPSGRTGPGSWTTVLRRLGEESSCSRSPPGTSFPSWRSPKLSIASARSS